MFVKTVPNKKSPEKSIAFIEGYPAFFPKDDTTVPYSEVNVMITGVVHKTYTQEDFDKGVITVEAMIGSKNYSSIKALFIQRVTEDDIHVHIDGFCSDNSYRVMSTATLADPTKTINGEREWQVTAGRVGAIVTGNINAGSTWNIPYSLKRGINGYIETNPEKGTMRLKGVDGIDYLQARYDEHIRRGFLERFVVKVPKFHGTYMTYAPCMTDAASMFSRKLNVPKSDLEFVEQ